MSEYNCYAINMKIANGHEVFSRGGTGYTPRSRTGLPYCTPYNLVSCVQCTFYTEVSNEIYYML